MPAAVFLWHAVNFVMTKQDIGPWPYLSSHTSQRSSIIATALRVAT